VRVLAALADVLPGSSGRKRASNASGVTVLTSVADVRPEEWVRGRVREVVVPGHIYRLVKAISSVICEERNRDKHDDHE
jgi:hypothetical protein